MNYHVFKRLMLSIFMISISVEDVFCMRAAARAWDRLRTTGHSVWRRAEPVVKVVCSKPLLTAGAGLCLVGHMTDRYRARNFEFIDVSNPSRPQPLRSCDVNIDDLAGSFTKLQIEHDYPVDCTADPAILDHPPRAMTKPDYAEHVNLVLASSFWVLDSQARKKLLDFTLHMSQEEKREQAKGNITAYHGTHQGAAIVLRTVFDQVFNGVDRGSVMLRDNKVIAETARFSSSEEYQNALWKEVKMVDGGYMQSPLGSGKVKLPPEIVFPDGRKFDDEHPKVRDCYLPCNIGLYGHSSWIRYGTKESSFEFVARPLSWLTRAVDCADHMTSRYTPLVVYDVISALIDDPSAVMRIDRVIDGSVKKLNDTKFFENIFKDYGLEWHYRKYAPELEKFKRTAGFGIVQLSMPAYLADRHSYLSSRMGEIYTHFDYADSKNPVRIRDVSTLVTKPDFAKSQLRVLMHPDIAKSSKTRVKFYLLAEPDETRYVIDRMYQIAYEIQKKELARM